MSTTTNATQSTNASAIFSIGTWNPTPTPDPRSVSSFEAKSIALKLQVKEKLADKLYKLPQGLCDLLFRWCVLSGSSISSIYHNETPKDFDLWCKDAEMLPHIEKAIKEKYSDQIMTYGEQDGYDNLRDGNQGHAPLITHNAITLKGNIQFITLGTYENQRKLFDLVHCLPYYDLELNTFYISPHQMDCVANKKLVTNPGGKTPTDWRIGKFQKRGWTWAGSGWTWAG